MMDHLSNNITRFVDAMPGQSIESVQNQAKSIRNTFLGANLNLPLGRLSRKVRRKVQEGSAGRFEPSSYFGL